MALNSIVYIQSCPLKYQKDLIVDFYGLQDINFI